MDFNLPTPALKVVFTVIFGIAVSWVLIHLLAVFGVFLAFAYPIWCLLLPNKVPNFICFIKHQINPFSQDEKEIERNKNLCSQKFSTALANAGLILLISLFCAGFVFGESKILFKFGFPPTPKTVSFVIPPKGQYRLGEIFPLKIEIYGIKVPVNSVQADLGFNPERLEVVDISTRDSFANIFIQKEINNEAGYARLTGGLPNPGFFSDHGLFGTVYLRGKVPGVAKIEFLPSSLVLANDGRGTNVLKELVSVSYLILPERISQEEEKMQEEMILKSRILGKESDKTQMRLYEENKILGANVDREIQEKKERRSIDFFLGLLEKVDAFILRQWEIVLSVFRF